MNAIKTSWKFYKKWLWKGIYVLFLSFISITFTLLVPQITQLIIDFVFSINVSIADTNNNIFSFLVQGSFGEIGSMQLLSWLCTFFLSFILLKNIILYFKKVYWHRFSQIYGREVRSFGFNKFMERSTFKSAGDTFVLLTNDVTSFKNVFVFNIPYCIESTFQIMFGLIFLFRLSSPLAWIVISTLPIVIIICLIFTKKSSPILEKAREEFSNLSINAQENVVASKSLKSFNIASTNINRILSTNEKYYNAKKKEVTITASYVFWLGIYNAFVYGLMITFGIIFASKGLITVGAFVSVLSYVVIIMTATVELFKFIFDLETVLVSAERFSNFISSKNKTYNFKAKTVITRSPNIQIEKLKLEFKEKEVFSKISLNIPFGKKVAIVGYQGEGKSMIAAALLRFMDAEAGSISINGLDIKEITADSLRSQFSFVPQDTFLFADTVRENIMLFNPSGEEEAMFNAIKIVGLNRWLDNVKGGINYAINENGSGVPAQERQLISFARALYKNAPVLLLDSPFSVFDFEDSELLRKNIFEFYKDRTIILITNHPKDALICDEIAFLNKGKITEIGTPEELLALNGDFADFLKKNMDDDNE